MSNTRSSEAELEKESMAWVATIFILCATIAGLFAFISGAADNERTWTASDIRGEVQRRMTELDERDAAATTDWQRLKIQAEREELLAIMEPYDDNR